MNQQIKKQAVIFDLDGTLWDSTERLAEIWSRVQEEYARISRRLTVQDIRPLMGKQMDAIAAALWPELPQERQLELIKLCGEAETESLRKTGGILYDGVEEVLKILREKYNLMIVSNCQAGYIPAFLEGHKLGSYFCDFEEANRIGKSKADNIRLVMERNKIKHAVYIGDTEGDETASKQAGIPFIFASYGFGQVVNPDEIIKNFREIPACVGRIFQNLSANH